MGTELVNEEANRTTKPRTNGFIPELKLYSRPNGGASHLKRDSPGDQRNIEQRPWWILPPTRWQKNYGTFCW
jgi:hypothetical protein